MCENCSLRRLTSFGCTVFRHKRDLRVIRYDAALARGKKGPGWRCSVLRYLQYQMIIKPIFGYPRLASGVPREFS
jgi:hypothetical protein